MKITKQLFLSSVNWKGNILRFWVLWDYSKTCPQINYFWDTPKKFYEHPPEYAPDDWIVPRF